MSNQAPTSVPSLSCSSGIALLRGGFSLSAGKARGSAMTEFYFLTMIMLPLFFGIPMIGKLIDLKQAAVQASRYAAWEATVHSGADEHANAPAYMQDRFFGDEDALISSAPSEEGHNKLWGDSVHGTGRGEQSAIRINEATVTATSENVGDGSVASTIGSAVHTAGNAIGRFSDGKWDLEQNGMVKRTVSLEVQANDWVSTSLSSCSVNAAYGCLSESAVIMTDGWSSGNDVQAAERVKSLVPASALHKVGKLVSNVGRIPLFEELKDLDDAFGYVTLEPLPQSEKLPRWKENEQ